MKTIVLLMFCLQLIEEGFCNLRWLSYDKYPTSEDWKQSDVCTKKYGLTGKQVRFCKKRFHWMQYVQEASTGTREECQHQLRAQKWNCLSLDKAPSFDHDLKRDTKQAAFVYALSAASLAISVARGCMSGQIPECSCYHSQRQVSFASDIINTKNMSNIDKMLPCRGITKFGQRVSRSFMSLGFRSKPKNEQQKNEIAVQKHNINLGLTALGPREDITCTCNGATAGCVVQFCHRHIVRIEDVATRLMKKYKNATKLKLTASKLPLKLDASLVYTTDNESPCNQQATTRRRCELDDSKENSCKNLCCGRGYQEKTIEISKQCNCRFQFCCKVVCDVCKSIKKVFECL